MAPIELIVQILPLHLYKCSSLAWSTYGQIPKYFNQKRTSFCSWNEHPSDWISPLKCTLIQTVIEVIDSTGFPHLKIYRKWGWYKVLLQINSSALLSCRQKYLMQKKTSFCTAIYSVFHNSITPSPDFSGNHGNHKNWVPSMLPQ